MILIDTSIWVDHFHSPDQYMIELLSHDLVLMHPWIVGELACCYLPKRFNTILALRELPQIALANEDEVLFLVEQYKLMGRGIGYVDMHLLASVKVHGAELWSRDKRLVGAAVDLQISHMPADGNGAVSRR